jgi:hypothetical protein
MFCAECIYNLLNWYCQISWIVSDDTQNNRDKQKTAEAEFCKLAV